MTNSVMSLVRALYPFGYSVVSEGSDLAVEQFRKFLDFKVHEFPSGAEVNGWVVPNAWNVHEAKIFHRGQMILDVATNPLGVGVLSPSFCGTISLEALREHLFFSEAQPDALPYHWTNLYRPSEKTWAFCVTKRFYDSLEPGDYEVRLQTREVPGTMKVLDYLLEGDSEQQIILNAHNCHPWQANDDISGCAAGISVIQRLAALERRRFSYRLIVAPELIGTVHWLDRLGDTAKFFAGAILMKSVGNPGLLKLQQSFTGNSQLDRAAEVVLRDCGVKHETGAFRTVYGNDETVFDSPGYEIPSISFTRFPFDQYHSSADTPDCLSEKALAESCDLVFETCNALEISKRLRFSGRGLVSLSNAKYHLYKAAPAPGMDKAGYTASAGRWNLLMNCLPRELTGASSGIDLALKYGIPVKELCNYLDQWQERGLAIEQKENSRVDTAQAV
jgi:aminopeptidase-like protein